MPVLRLQCNPPMVITFQGAPVDGYGDPIAPIPGQRWFGDGSSLIIEKFPSWELTWSCGEDESKVKQWNRRKCSVKVVLAFQMPKSLIMDFHKVFNIWSWKIRIEVVLARKKVEICGNQESKRDLVVENKNNLSNRIFLDRKWNKQLGMRFLVNKSLKATSTNLVNKRIAT